MATITRTARQVVLRSLRMIGAVGQGQTLDAEQENDALDVLNELVASWSAEGLMVFATEIESFSLTAGTISYTIGSGGDFDTDRPKQIIGGYLSDGEDYFLTPMTQREWNSIPNKTVRARPRRFYYRPDYPLGVIYFDFTPSDTFSVSLELVNPLGSIAQLTTTLVLPPEYARALAANLAIDIAPEYEIVPSPAIVKIAEESKEVVRHLNFANSIQEAEFDDLLIHGVPERISGNAGGSYVIDDDGISYPL